VLAANAPHVELAIDRIDNGGPGQSPTVELTTNTVLSHLVATIAGPNTDYATSWQAPITDSVSLGGNRYRFTFPQPMPSDARGSYTLGLEGDVVIGGVRYAAESPVRAFAVTDAVAQPRRQIVDGTACNACHRDLAAHDGARKNPQYCITCHAPPSVRSTPRIEGTTATAPSGDFRVMIHALHREGFPRPLAQCEACHLPSTSALPIASSLPSTGGDHAERTSPISDSTQSGSSTGPAP